MATYTEQATLVRDPNFVERVMMAMTLAALQVRAEAITVANHLARSNYAVQVLNDPEHHADDFAVAVAAALNPAPATNASVTDAQIKSTVDSVFGALAGDNPV